MRHLTLGLSLLLLASPLASAFGAPPAPVPQPPPLPRPEDKPFPGMIDLKVDATNIDQHIVRVEETVPVPAGKLLILLFPRWLPGNHAPSGPLPQLAGLTATAGGKPVAWRRDAVDMGAFHIDAPVGARAVTVQFQFLSPLDSQDGRVVMTPNMVEVEWRPDILFPAGYYQRDIPVHASVSLPEGFQYATALEIEHAKGGEIAFKTTSLDILLDSPVLAGRYFSRIDLDPGAATSVHLDVVADQAKDLEIKPEDLQAHRNLVQQAYKNFGGHHYDHYDFLFSLSSEMGGVGLEHQRSSEDGLGPTYFTDPDKSAPFRDLLPHEYTHSWNGKFMRPADLWSPDDHTVPERDSLLWVYEGQTEYWGQVLAARSGILKADQVRDLLALEAAKLDAATPGRAWRNLQDTTNDPIIAWHQQTYWVSWSRNSDYYPEAALIWLDVDTLIREKSGGKKSLTDFAHLFFNVDGADWTTHTYTFADLVRALNQVQPYDWASFLRARLDGHGPGAPLDGLKRGGWTLVYTDIPSSLQKAEDAMRKGTDLSYSLGLSLAASGSVRAVVWDGPAFKAGLAPGDKIEAVNGGALDGVDTLTDAITAAKGGATPIELLVRDGTRYRTVRIDYHGGLRYPHLERIVGAPDRLDDILAPLK